MAVPDRRTTRSGEVSSIRGRRAAAGDLERDTQGVRGPAGPGRAPYADPVGLDPLGDNAVVEVQGAAEVGELVAAERDPQVRERQVLLRVAALEAHQQPLGEPVVLGADRRADLGEPRGPAPAASTPASAAAGPSGAPDQIVESLICQRAAAGRRRPSRRAGRCPPVPPRPTAGRPPGQDSTRSRGSVPPRRGCVVHHRVIHRRPENPIELTMRLPKTMKSSSIGSAATTRRRHQARPVRRALRGRLLEQGRGPGSAARRSGCWPPAAARSSRSRC